LPITRHPDSDSFRCDIEHDRERVVVRPQGELDLATVDQVEEPLQQLRSAGFRDLVVDLRFLTFLDSTGISLLVRWQRAAADGGPAFSVILGDESVTRPLELTGVLGLLEVREW
jgi:anti-anti-sigma factor